MKLSDYLAEVLAKEVKHVFCGNGGVVIHILDSIESYCQMLCMALSDVLKHQCPMLCDVRVKHGEQLLPKLVFGRPLEDLAPLLDRDELKKNLEF